MWVRASVLARVSMFVVLSLAALALFASGCGRSQLIDEITDAGPGDARPDSDAHACNASTCPNGCCDASGVCKSGTGDNACGGFGRACRDCIATGFDLCEPSTHACGRVTDGCGPGNCSGGCCSGDICLSGTDPDACGNFGQQCARCGSSGLACDASTRTCTTSTGCGPENCSGCCLGDTCLTGSDPTACGLKGEQCQNCAGLGLTCSPTFPGGQCVASACNPSNCAGCCEGDVCLSGTDINECGAGGAQCQSCSSFGVQCTSFGPGRGGFCGGALCGPQNCKGCCNGDICMDGTSNGACGVAGKVCATCATNATCSNGACTTTPPPVCTPQTCPGCCDAQGKCEGGFLDTACGSSGASCFDCSLKNAVCDGATNPRSCTTQQQTCPAPYGSCPGSLSTPIEPVQHVCSANELQQASAACNQADSASCQAFFSFEQQTNPGCASCLRPFDVSFLETTGIFNCVAPFVDASCNHTTACFDDCVAKSCAGCPAGSSAQCKADVSNAQCNSFWQDISCAFDPMFGGAATFCNPQNYSSFGAWLQGVGGHYCGP